VINAAGGEFTMRYSTPAFVAARYHAQL